MRYYYLNSLERRILQHLAHIVLPEIPADLEMFSRKALYHIDRFLLQLSPVLGLLFHLGAIAFNVLPLFSFLSLQSFVQCSLSTKHKWACKVARTRFTPLNSWFFVVRGLILLVYYSQCEQHQDIAYKPGEWAKEKIIQRRRQLNIIEEASDDSYSKKYHRQSH
ncbi:MAG: hypothetical protein ACE5I1_11500 [bacterium]